MAKRRTRNEEQPRELTRKQIRINARTRERNRKIMLGAGIAVGLALLLVIVGAVNEFVIRPSSTIATVGDTSFTTRDFWKRLYLQQNQMLNQLANYQALEQQFGGQGFFTQQISQLQATLSSPFSLGTEVLNQMINEEVIRQEATRRGISVTAEEIEQALREEVAARQGAVTEQQATATATAAIEATATAESWTPTPTPTIDASLTVTVTATPSPTPEPAATRPILTGEQYTTGLADLEKNLRSIAGMSLNEYRKVIEARLLTEKLQDAIGEEQVEATEEQIHARHILLEVREPDPSTVVTATVSPTGTTNITMTDGVTATESATEGTAESTAESATEVVTEVVTETVAEAITETVTDAVTDTVAATDTVTATDTEATDTVTETDAITETETPDDIPTPEPTPEPRDDAATLALAQELRQRILDGEDFDALAREYSDEPGAAESGGDLGWFGRGVMVSEFEEAAFALEVGEISEPVRSSFGYHIIEVLEKDPNRPKEEFALERERLEAFNIWLTQTVAEADIQRPEDLGARLPRDINSRVLTLPQ